MKKTIRTIVMMVLVLAIITSTVTTVLAEVKEGEQRYLSMELKCKRNSDVPENYYITVPEYKDWYVLTYNGFLTSIRYYRVMNSKDTPSEQVAYCIEFGVKNSTGLHNIQNINQAEAWKKLSQEQKDGIKRATLYGYPNNNYGVKNCDAYAATQLIIWEFQLGLRSIDGTVDPALINSITAFAGNDGFDVGKIVEKVVLPSVGLAHIPGGDSMITVDDFYSIVDDVGSKIIGSDAFKSDNIINADVLDKISSISTIDISIPEIYVPEINLSLNAA